MWRSFRSRTTPQQRQLLIFLQIIIWPSPRLCSHILCSRTQKRDHATSPRRAHPNFCTSNIRLYSSSFHYPCRTIFQTRSGSEANNFPVTPIPVALQPSRTRSSQKSTNFVSSMVRVPPGSSLLHIQNYHSSSDDSPVSPSPPPSAAKRGLGKSGAESHRRCSLPQFADSFTSKKRSPPHRSANTGRTTRQSQCLHTPADFPDRLSTSKITDWTVTTPQKTLNGKWILFHQMDYKAKLSPNAC